MEKLTLLTYAHGKTSGPLPYVFNNGKRKKKHIPVLKHIYERFFIMDRKIYENELNHSFLDARRFLFPKYIDFSNL